MPSQNPSQKDDEEHSDGSVISTSPTPERIPNAQDVSNQEHAPERPKKRRKIDIQSTIEDQAANDETAMQEEDTVDPPPTVESALPRFPLPRRPDAPSQSALALQGQDKALVEAELVDPRQTANLKDSGLTERTLKRLEDLGIQELFAGM